MPFSSESGIKSAGGIGSPSAGYQRISASVRIVRSPSRVNCGWYCRRNSPWRQRPPQPRHPSRAAPAFLRRTSPKKKRDQAALLSVCPCCAAEAALRRSTSGSGPSPGNMLIPRFAPMKISRPSIANGASRQSSSFRAEPPRLFPIGEAARNEHKFVSAHPRQHIRPARDPAKPRRRFVQQLIPRRVSERIVHHLEVIEIDEKYRAANRASPAGDRSPLPALPAAAAGWADQ